MAKNPMIAHLFTKAKSLWEDKRTYKKRLLLSASVWAAFCYTFIFFGPLEMVAFAGNSLEYSYKEVLVPLLVLALGIWAVMSALTALIRGKVFNYVVTAGFSVLVAGYLQGAVLNGNLGKLTGDAIAWEVMFAKMVVNLGIWIYILLVFLFLMYLKRSWWRKTLIAVSLALVVMQVVPTATICLGSTADSEEVGALTEEGMTAFSAKDNIFVFVLDRLDYDYIEEVLADDPAFFDRLDGFTAYTDAISGHARTQPALSEILTGGRDLAFTIPSKEYFAKCWDAKGQNMLKALDSKGYDISLYTKLTYLFPDNELPSKYVSNYGTNKGDINTLSVLFKLMKLSIYRYAPIAIKPFFWADTTYYNNGAYSSATGKIYNLNKDSVYGERLANGTASAADSAFKLYHFHGTHSPYTMREDGTKANTNTSVLEQAKGSFNNLIRIFDRMKELGIYENATIIITGDHGAAMDDYAPVKKETRIGLFYKPAGKQGTPIVWSAAPVATENIPATLLKAAGVDYSAYGRALDEVGEDEILTRTYYKTAQGGSANHETILYTYSITGKASDFANWKIISAEEIPAGNNFY